MYIVFLFLVLHILPVYKLVLIKQSFFMAFHELFYLYLHFNYISLLYIFMINHILIFYNTDHMKNLYIYLNYFNFNNPHRHH